MNSATLRACEHWSRLGLLALLIAACGGRAATDASPSDPGSTSAGDGGGGAQTSSGGRASAPHGGGSSNGTNGNPGAADGGAGARNGDGGGAVAAGGSVPDAGADNAGDSNGGSAGSVGEGGDAGAAGSGGTTSTPCNPIVFSDPNFERAVRKAAQKPSGDLNEADVASVIDLEADQGVESLGGIECLPIAYLYLDAAGNTNHVTDLSPLARVKTLQHLEITGNPVADLTPLGGLPSLNFLAAGELGRAVTPAEIEALAGLPELAYLELMKNPLGSLAPLGKSPSLVALNLASAQLSAPETIAGLTQLFELELSDTNIAPAIVTPLTRLVYLGLASNHITDISALAPLVNLERLDLSDNQVVDISVLAGMSGMQEIDFAENRIASLSPLSNLQSLTTLFLDQNAITSLAPLVQDPGISVFDLVSVSGNPLDCHAESANIAELRNRHVSLTVDCP